MTPDPDSDPGRELEPGMVVVDREQALVDRDPAVVMSRPPVDAADWDLDYREATLADDNPDYPADTRTTIVIYRNRFEDTEEYDAVNVPDNVREKLGDGDPVSVATAADLCKFYAFPEPRLEPTGDRWPPAAESAPATDDEADVFNANGDGEPEPKADTQVGAEADAPDAEGDLDRLAAVVREAGYSGVQQRDGGVEATKLGETYRVDRNGEVVEGGGFASKLESVVEEEYTS